MLRSLFVIFLEIKCNSDALKQKSKHVGLFVVTGCTCVSHGHLRRAANDYKGDYHYVSLYVPLQPHRWHQHES